MQDLQGAALCSFPSGLTNWQAHRGRVLVCMVSQPRVFLRYTDLRSGMWPDASPSPLRRSQSTVGKRRHIITHMLQEDAGLGGQSRNEWRQWNISLAKRQGACCLFLTVTLFWIRFLLHDRFEVAECGFKDSWSVLLVKINLVLVSTDFWFGAWRLWLTQGQES